MAASMMNDSHEYLLEKKQLQKLKEEKGCEVCDKRDEKCKPWSRGFCPDWNYNDDE